jgi:NAD(P)-dependent dehydrogenase (short-subunit alcohol dehydrogenase family)
MFDLSGRVAILTGGAGMLGRQYTRTLLAAGAKVVVADANAEQAVSAAQEAMAEVGGDALPCTVDVRDKSQVDKLVETAVASFGRLDILINNAAIDPKLDSAVAGKLTSSFEDYPLELWQQSLDVNLTGAFLCSQAAGRVMVSAKRGVVVNVCSTYGLVGPDQRIYERAGQSQPLYKPAAYAVTKGGIAQFTRYLAAYWGHLGIRVNTLTPGGVFNAQDDEFVVKYASRTPLARMADKNEMNGAMLFLVSDASTYMTGANLVVDGGWTAW